MNFTIRSVDQDSSGVHTVTAKSEEGHVLTFTTSEKKNFEVGRFIWIDITDPTEQVSASPAVVAAKPLEQEQPSAGTTDEQPRQFSDSVSEEKAKTAS